MHRLKSILAIIMIPAAIHAAVPQPSLAMVGLTPSASIALFDHASSALPLPTIIPGVKPDCAKLSTGFSPQCFDLLDVASYFLQYNSTIRLETCSPSQPWSQCFQISAMSNGDLGPTPANITHYHNCTYLSLSPSNTTSCTAPSINDTSVAWSLGNWYGVWSIYSLQTHISHWTQALVANSSADAVTNTTTSNPAWNVSRVVADLITHNGVDPGPDSALLKLLLAPNSTIAPATVPPQPTIQKQTPQRVPLPDNGHEGQPPSTAQWQSLIQQRMQELLLIVSLDFNRWLLAAGNGSFASGTFKGSVGVLKRNLAT